MEKLQGRVEAVQVCVCVCMCVCVRIRYLCTCYVIMCMYMYVRMYVCMCMYKGECMYVCMYVHTNSGTSLLWTPLDQENVESYPLCPKTEVVIEYDSSLLGDLYGKFSSILVHGK